MDFFYAHEDLIELANFSWFYDKLNLDVNYVKKALNLNFYDKCKCQYKLYFN